MTRVRADRPHLYAHFAPAILVAVVAMTATLALAPAGAASPVVTLTPTTPYANSQIISVSVGPNGLFTPHAKVNILECADPGGSPANLPVDDSTCDGNTIQGGTIPVQNNGSFSTNGYQIFQLPSSVLGEQANNQPVCSATAACVLYVGQDQNDFTAPKVFSTPFYVIAKSTSSTPTTVAPVSGAAPGSSGATSSGATSSGSGSSATAGATAANGSGSSTGSTAGGSGDPSKASGTLAFTGLSASWWVLVAGSLLGVGAVLLLVAAAARRRLAGERS